MENQQQEIGQGSLSKFNYANAILQRIDYLQFKASEYYRIGELDSWYFEWKNIKLQLVGRLKDKEDGKLIKLETKITFLLDKAKRTEGHNKLLVLLVEEYVAYIQKKIEAWGMGLINQTDERIFA